MNVATGLSIALIVVSVLFLICIVVGEWGWWRR